MEANLLEPDAMTYVLKLVATEGIESFARVQRHIAARLALSQLEAGGTQSVRLLSLLSLVAKGVFWAAAQAMPLLTKPERAFLLEASHRSKLFSRRQLHILRSHPNP